MLNKVIFPNGQPKEAAYVFNNCSDCGMTYRWNLRGRNPGKCVPCLAAEAKGIIQGGVVPGPIKQALLTTEHMVTREQAGQLKHAVGRARVEEKKQLRLI
jgi:hypothetical protein